MPKRETAASASQRSAAPKKPRGKVTDAFVHAGKENLAKGRAKRDKIREQAKDAGLDPAPVRWAQLLDGTITVRDLDDEELERFRMRSKDGLMSGRPAMVPSHIAQAMRSEGIRRFQETIENSLLKIADTLLDIMENGEKDSDKIRAADILSNRILGKAPETITVRAETGFEELLRETSGIDIDRERVDE